MQVSASSTRPSPLCKNENPTEGHAQFEAMEKASAEVLRLIDELMAG
jgi:hypothetical protein